jgi:hypothetical protein
VTLRDELFRTAVVDGGALGAVAIDIATRTPIAGFAHAELVRPGLVELLLGAVRPSGPLTRLCGGAPPAAARELFIAGADRAVYCTVVDHRALIIVATPAAMSVALGWALVRVLVAAEAAP